MGTVAARSWHDCRHGLGTPRVDAVAMDASSNHRTRAGHAISRDRVPVCSQTVGVQRLCDAETLKARCWHGPGHAHGTARDRLVCRTGGMLSSTSSVGDGAATASYRPGAVPKAFQERSESVPEGGKMGGIQTSAPQVRPRALPDMAAVSRGHDGGTIVAPDTFGPTAHKSVSSLLVLLGCCDARPSGPDP